MGCIIVAMPVLEDAKKISEMLMRQGIATDAVCSLSSEVLHKAHERDSGIVICGKKLKDMNYAELSGYLPDYFGMIVISKDVLEFYAQNIFFVQSPFKIKDLIGTMNMISAQNHLRIRKNKGKPPSRSNEEREIINKAKLLLMERNQMSEPDAYRYIQKCSMDSGNTMLETAQMILLLAEDM